MGIFDFLVEMEEKNEKRKQAEEYRKRAREYVRDGEALYNKAYSEVSSYAYDTSRKIEQHYNYKQKVIREISSDISPVLSGFEKFNIDSKIFDSPDISGTRSTILSGSALLGNSFTSVMPRVNLLSLLDLFSDVGEEYYEARRQRDEAKRFYEDMKYEREKLRNAKENLKNIRNVIIDERELLDGMLLRLKQITIQLNSEMNKQSFSHAEAMYLKGIHKIASSVNSLISTKFLNDNFTITSQYEKSLDKIKSINNSLQSAPTISSDNKEWLRILEIIIVS